VCRTDLQLAEGDIPARRLPVVPGHQAVGTVEAVGPGVSGWQPGERAGVAWLGSTCGSCRHCRSGSENLCPNARFTGWDLDGGFAELVTVRADFALRMPSAFSDVDGAPLLCGGVIGYRALKLTGIERGGRLGLFGFGASARLTIQVAVHRGYEVHVWTRSRVERERAIELGATWTGGYDKAPPSQLDAAVTFAPSGDVVVAALGALAPGGSVVVNAIHLDRIPEFRYELLWSERVLRSVANFTREDAREFLTIAPAIPIRTEVDRFSLADGNEALRRVAAGRIRGAAVLIPA
jgi:propanol-preferring alcohol dehydrogenase